LISLLCVVNAADIVVFGDSWGTYGRASFEKMAASHGLTVDNVAVSGSKASDWAQDPNCLLDAVNLNPDARYVWLTIGGNDARPLLEQGVPVDTMVAQVTADIVTFLVPLLNAKPTIKLVMFGYDILFWDYAICKSTGDKMFVHYCGSRSDPNYIACANQLFYTIQYKCTDLLASKYKQVSSPNLLGSWQHAGGIPGAEIGKPVDKFFSPNQFTAPLKLCLHANDKGYDVTFANLWDLFFSKHENQTTPVRVPEVWADEKEDDSEPNLEQLFEEWKAIFAPKSASLAEVPQLSSFKQNFVAWVAANGTLPISVSELGFDLSEKLN